MSEIIYTSTAKNAMLGAVAALLDQAETPGRLKIHGDGEPPVLLADIALATPCGAVTGGELVLSCPLADENLAASGAAAFGELVDGDGNLIATLTVGPAESTAAIRLNQTALYQGGILRITAAALGLE